MCAVWQGYRGNCRGAGPLEGRPFLELVRGESFLRAEGNGWGNRSGWFHTEELFNISTVHFFFGHWIFPHNLLVPRMGIFGNCFWVFRIPQGFPQVMTAGIIAIMLFRSFLNVFCFNMVWNLTKDGWKWSTEAWENTIKLKNSTPAAVTYAVFFKK